MRISKKPEERRSEILDISTKLFVSQGFEETTVDMIVNRIGIAKGTFYYYFKSKDDVLHAIIINMMDLLEKNFTSVANDPSISATQKLQILLVPPIPEEFSRLLMTFYKICRAETQLMFTSQSIARGVPIFTQILRQGVQDGVFKIVHPEELAEYFVVNSHMLFELNILGWPPEKLVRKAKIFLENVAQQVGLEKNDLDSFLGQFNSMVFNHPLTFNNYEKKLAYLWGRKYVFLPEVDSTNRYLLEHGTGTGEIAFALHQTAARAGHGRVWKSIAGDMLQFTVLLPQISPSLLAEAQIAAGHAVVDALSPYANVQINWPNELVADGRKIGAMLIESLGDKTVLGVGIHMSAPIDHTNAALSEFCGELPEQNVLLAELVNSLEDRFSRFAE